MTFVVSLLVVLTAEFNLQHLNVIITRSLKLSGDAELNPGPSEIIRSVQGSFNQGNAALFGETADRQCACNALFSNCWSVFRDICNWKSFDLDYILVQGDKLCKSLKCRDYLNVDQLPGQVKIFERTANLDISEENLHDSIAVYGDSFLTDVFTISNVNTSSGCILFLCSYAVALFRYLNGRGNGTYFLFDSHCWNSGGITDGGPGFSVRMKRKQKQAKKNLQETRDRKHKKIQMAKMGAKFKNLQGMKKSRVPIGFVKNQGQEH